MGNNVIKVYPGDYGTEPIEIVQQEGVNITLEAVGEVVLTSQIQILGSTRSSGDETLTISGFTFDFSDAPPALDIISAPDKLPNGNYSYAHNISIQNNTFKGNPSVAVVAIRTQRAFGLEIRNCTGDGLHSLGQILAQSKYLRVADCVVSSTESGINYYGPSDAKITGLTVYGSSYGIRAGQNSGTVLDSSLTIADSHLEAQYPVWLRIGAPGTVVINNSTLTPIGDEGEMIHNVTNGSVNITIDGEVYVTSDADLRAALAD